MISLIIALLCVLESHLLNLEINVSYKCDIPPSLLTVCGVRVIAARGIFSPLLLALHLSGGGRKAWRQGEGANGGGGGGEHVREKFTMKNKCDRIY